MTGGTLQAVGWYRFYFGDERWEWSAEVAQIHGYQPGTVTPTTQLVLSHKHPDDYRYIAATLDDIRRTHKPLSTRHRIITVQGQTRDIVILVSDFAAEIGVRNYPRLAVFSGDPRGVVHARVQRRAAASDELVGGDEVGDLPAGHRRGDQPGRGGAQVAGGRVDGDRDPAHREGRRLAALARKPGRPGTQRDWQLEAARAEIAQLTEAVKAQAIELAVVRGKAGWG